MRSDTPQTAWHFYFWLPYLAIFLLRDAGKLVSVKRRYALRNPSLALFSDEAKFRLMSVHQECSLDYKTGIRKCCMSTHGESQLAHVWWPLFQKCLVRLDRPVFATCILQFVVYSGPFRPNLSSHDWQRDSAAVGCLRRADGSSADFKYNIKSALVGPNDNGLWMHWPPVT